MPAARRTPAALGPDPQFCDRHRFAESLHGRALDFPEGKARAGLLHLSDLYAHCASFYPTLDLPPSEGLPFAAVRALFSAGSSSSAAACLEA